MIATWYLVFSFWSNGGIAVIPQASKSDCLLNVQWLRDDERKYGNVNAACIPGAALPVAQK